MANKEKEVKQNAPKRKSLASTWFDDYTKDNRLDMEMVCSLTAKSVAQQFSIYTANDNDKIFAAIFYSTYMSILDFIKSKETMYSEFTIQIGNSINIGYAQNNTDGNEMAGGFMPIFEHIGFNKRIVDSGSTIDANRTEQNFLKWKELNTKKNVEMYKEIQENAYLLAKTEYKIDTRTSEAIIPFFCTFMDNIVEVLKFKWSEADGTDVSQVSMSVFGLFTVYYKYDSVDDEEVIEVVPNASTKLGIKSDAKAIRE